MDQVKQGKFEIVSDLINNCVGLFEDNMQHGNKVHVKGDGVEKFVMRDMVKARSLTLMKRPKLRRTGKIKPKARMEILTPQILNP